MRPRVRGIQPAVYVAPPIPPRIEPTAPTEPIFEFEIETWLRAEASGRVDNKASSFVKVLAKTSAEAEAKVVAMFKGEITGWNNGRNWSRKCFVKSAAEVRP